MFHARILQGIVTETRRTIGHFSTKSLEMYSKSQCGKSWCISTIVALLLLGISMLSRNTRAVETMRKTYLGGLNMPGNVDLA